ncbi:Uncharacterised protein [Serratia quinivorans]|uniref:Uncharacterized protein n=1 Tax=Serratia quinivorans TaxID=137545 RepID=A0A379YBY6_9GAMM|nr:Uncharacterised protein [Serratia quinivorans]SUI43284.1 Uncharacterised protein [Serratia quinivorans]
MLITYLRAHPTTPIAHTLMEGMRSQVGLVMQVQLLKVIYKSLKK